MSEPIAPVDADFEEIADQRRSDRRAQERRISRMRLDPLFAATLINHVAEGEAGAATSRYALQPPTSGAIVNLRA